MSPHRPRVLAVAATLAVAAGTLLAPSPASAAPRDPNVYEKRVVRQVNNHRADLPEVAKVRGGRCADKFAEQWAKRVHRGKGLPALTRAKRRCGGVASAVGVYRKSESPAALLEALESTPGGARVLNNRAVRQVGVGALVDKQGRWTVVVVVTGKKQTPPGRPGWNDQKPGDPVEQPPVEDPSETPGEAPEDLVDDEMQTYIEEIYAATNAERVKHGLPEFQQRPCADGFAQDHSEWMQETGKFEHADLGLLIDACPVSYVGENIAYTYRTGGEYVVDLWMNSPGHRRNILNPEFTHLGVGVAYEESTGRWYSTQDFTGPDR